MTKARTHNDDLNRQGRRVGDGNKKLRYVLYKNDLGDIEGEFITIQEIADYLNVSFHAVQYLRRNDCKFRNYHNQGLKGYNILKV